MNKMISGLTSLLIALSLSLAACGDNSTGVPETRADACSEIAVAVCSQAAECGSTSNFDDCVKFAGVICDSQEGDPRSDWQTCENEMADLSCDTIQAGVWDFGACFSRQR